MSMYTAETSSADATVGPRGIPLSQWLSPVTSGIYGYVWEYMCPNMGNNGDILGNNMYSIMGIYSWNIPTFILWYEPCSAQGKFLAHWFFSQGIPRIFVSSKSLGQFHEFSHVESHPFSKWRLRTSYSRSHPILLNVSGWWCNNHLEKYEFVNGKDDIPYMKWKIIFMFWNHQPGFNAIRANLWSPPPYLISVVHRVARLVWFIL